MNAKNFIEQYGRDEARRIAQLAGTNYAYFSQLASGNRRPSVGLAQKLVTSSDSRLEFTALLLSKSEG